MSIMFLWLGKEDWRKDVKGKERERERERQRENSHSPFLKGGSIIS